MPRKPTGSLRIDRNPDGTVRYITLRFRAYGQRHEIPANTKDDIRAQGRLDEIVDQVARGVWKLPTLHRAPGELTFGEFVVEKWWPRKQYSLGGGLKACENEVEHLMGFFGPLTFSQITVEKLNQYRDLKISQPDRRVKNGTPKTLSPETVNKDIKRLAEILDAADDEDLLPATNPAKSKRRRFATPTPRRTALTPEQAEIVIETAAEFGRPSPETRAMRNRIVQLRAEGMY